MGYWEFNIKGKFLLISAALQICKATIFTKLDLHSAYNFIIPICEEEELKTVFITTKVVTTVPS